MKGSELLRRIMELHEKGVPADDPEMYRLETEWKNRCIDPRECPKKS